jgi:diguanylate cyclase (GGDEF)-like protein
MVSKKLPSLASIICRMATHATYDTGGSLNPYLDAVSDSVSADSYALLKILTAQNVVQIVSHKGLRTESEQDSGNLDTPRLIQEAIQFQDKPAICLLGSFSGDPFLLGEGARSLLMAKRDIEGDILATIAVRREDRAFSNSETERFAAAAHFLNLLGQCWHLRGDLRNRMGQDPLTGFMLYTGFHDVLSREISRARRGERSVSLGLVEVEGWEEYRHERGAETADRVLKSIACFIRERFRDFDTMARFSPSGFSFILPDLDAAIGVRVVARVIGELSEYMAQDPEIPPLQLRIGLACYPENATTTEKLLEMAEAALLKAVEARSSDVVIWEE